MPGHRPRVWLCATEPDRLDPLKVLAAELAEVRDAPEVVLGRAAEAGNPVGEDPLPANSPFDLVVLAGDTIPAALVEGAKARGAGLFWIAAGPAPRLDRRGFLPGRLRRVLSQLTEIHARDADAAAALRGLLRGAVPVHATGLPARLPPARPCNPSELEALRESLGGRPAWFAFSLPAAEFEAALAAHASALRQAHRLILIIAPRDPRDGPGLTDCARAAGFDVARRLAEDEIDESIQVYVADAEDDPGLFLRLAPVTYLGGSLTPGSGTPAPETAAALGTALVYGPETASGFLDRLRGLGGGRQIRRAGDLGGALTGLLAPESGAAAALQAWTLATQGSDVTWTLARAIRDWLALNRKAAS